MEGIVGTIKRVFDNHQEIDYSETLLKETNVLERGIQNLCDEKYKQFLDSVQSIITMKKDVASVQYEMKKVDRSLELIGGILKDQNTKHEYAADVCGVLDKVKKQLMVAQHVAKLAIRAQQYRDENGLYQMLKIVNRIEMEVEKLPDSKWKSDAILWMNEQRKIVVSQSKDVLAEWLQTMRNESKIIGHRAMMEYMNKLNRNWNHCVQQVLEYQNNGEPVLNEKGPMVDSDVVIDEESMQVTAMKQLLPKIQPLLRTVHLFQYIDDAPALEQFYLKNRLAQIQLQTQFSTDLSTIQPEIYLMEHHKALTQLAGEFIAEFNTAVNTPEPLISLKKLHEAMDSVKSEATSVMTRITYLLNDPDDICSIKKSAHTFASCLGNTTYKFDTHCMYSIFQDLSSTFIKTTKAYGKRVVVEQVEKFCFVYKDATTLNTQKLDRYHLHSQTSSNQVSMLVYVLCDLMDTFVRTMFEYVRYLDCQRWGSTVVNVISFFLLEINNEILKRIDDSENLHISQAVQLTMDAQLLASYCLTVDKSINFETQVLESNQAIEYQIESKDDSALFVASLPSIRQLDDSSAEACKSFTTSALRAEELICEIVVSKIDELLSAWYYISWTFTSVPQKSTDAIDDLVEYLQVAFMCLEPLSIQVQEIVKSTAYGQVHRLLKDILIGSKVASINRNGLLQCKYDIDAIFTMPGSSELVHNEFIHTKNLVDFLFSSQKNDITDVDIRNYSCVPPLNVSNTMTVVHKMGSGKQKTVTQKTMASSKKTVKQIFKRLTPTLKR